MTNADPASGKVVAAIPAFNEASTIASVIYAAQVYVDDVIVIDDGSTDFTGQIASDAGARVIIHQVNLGKAAGIMTAFRAAEHCGAEFLVLLDGDNQHNPHDIPKLLALVQEGDADVVVGSRFLTVRNPIPFYRTVGQRVLNIATQLGSGLSCSDSQCGFRALNRRAFTTIQLKESFMQGLAVESEMQFQMAAHGLRLAEIAIYVRYDRKSRRSPIKHGVGVLFRVLFLTTRARTSFLSKWFESLRRRINSQRRMVRE